jgi:DNA-binding NtrC family response regulator
VVDLYRHIELAETRFIDIGLQMRSPVLGSSADAPLPLYPRPAPQSAEYMPEMVVAGASMKKLMEEVQRAGRMDAPALIQGESGVGKELVARALHRLGHHARGPFIPINCAALAPDLIASELFGHVRGAYTGA